MKFRELLEVMPFSAVKLKKWDEDTETFTMITDSKFKYTDNEVLSVSAQLTTENRDFDNSIQVIPILVVVIK